MNNIKLRSGLLECLSNLPTNTVNERKSFLALVGLDHLRNKIALEGRTVDFLDSFLVAIAEEGQNKMTLFLDELINCYITSPEQKEKLYKYNEAINFLGAEEWNKFFIFSKPSDAEDIIQRCSRATELEIRNVVGRKYIPELYFPRSKIENNFKVFLESKDSCFLVVAKAGRGKTNLLCKVSQELGDKQPVLFLSGRKEPKDDYDFLRYISGRIGYGENWLACFEDLKRISETGLKPIILIDGINESAAKPIIMQSALRELLTQANLYGIKVCITCRTDFWSFYRAPFWGEFTWRDINASTSTRTLRGEDISIFPEEDFKQIVDHYFNFFRVQGELTEEAWERCRNPLLLRFFCEAYSQKNINVVSQIRLYPLFKLFWEKKTGNVADISGIKSQPIADFILTVAGLMHNGHRTRVARQSIGYATQIDFNQTGSLYDRILDEEIILEEEVDEQIGSVNIIFVYDKFSEYAIALSIFRDANWISEANDEILRQMYKLIKEEEEYQFATLRGSLEFLVMRLEDLRFTEGIHFEILKLMLEYDWKWRRIGTITTFQLTHTETPEFWAFIKSLTEHKRDFIRRICVEQLGQLAGKHTPQVLSLLNKCLEDKNDSVRQATKETLLRLDSAPAIQEALLLIRENWRNKQSIQLAAEVLLSPADSMSPLLQEKARWLVTENKEDNIKDAVYNFLNNYKVQSYKDWFILEEYERVFQFGRKRQSIPDNDYLYFIRQRIRPYQEKIKKDIENLELIRFSFNQTIKLLAEDFFVLIKEYDSILNTPLNMLIQKPEKQKYFFEKLTQLINKNDPKPSNLNYRTSNWDENQVLFNKIPLGELALEILRPRLSESVNETPRSPLQVLINLSLTNHTAPSELIHLYKISETIIKEAASTKKRAITNLTLSLEIGEMGLEIAPEKRMDFRNAFASIYKIEISDFDHRSWSSLGRLAIGIWEKEKFNRQDEQKLESRIIEIRHLDRKGLQQLLSRFEVVAVTKNEQRELSLEIQAICQAFLPTQINLITEALTDTIKWHSSNDSPILDQAFQNLYLRNRDNFWQITELLLSSDNQIVIDFASKVLEQAEYDESQVDSVEIFDQVKSIVVDLLGADASKVTPDARFREDLEADSLDLVELIMAMEDKFGKEVTDEDAQRISTVGEVVKYISSH